MASVMAPPRSCALSGSTMMGARAAAAVDVDDDDNLDDDLDLASIVGAASDDDPLVDEQDILDEENDDDHDHDDEHGHEDGASSTRRRWGSIKTWVFAHLLTSSFARSVPLTGRASVSATTTEVASQQRRHHVDSTTGHDRDGVVRMGTRASTNSSIPTRVPPPLVPPSVSIRPKAASSSAATSTSTSLAPSPSQTPPTSHPSSPSTSSSTTTTTNSSKTSTSYNDWDLVYSGPSAALAAISSSGHRLPPKPRDTNTTDSRAKSIHANANTNTNATRYEFDILRVIGSGSYGTVLLSRLRTNTNKLFAIKVVSKTKLRSDRADRRDARRLVTEKNVLAHVDHPFITKLYCAFETSQSLNFVMEYCAGGDMYFLLEKFPRNRLPERMVEFYAASMALAISHLHQRGILYRDLKPENILLDQQGFLRLADFGFAHEHVRGWADQSRRTFCGSADYIAPEVVAGTGYGQAADLWSFGCVIYELLTGFPPFYSPQDRPALFRKIACESPAFPHRFSPELRDLLTRLLHKDAHQRLGAGPKGMQAVFEHPFFARIDWYQLMAKQVVPPYVPVVQDALDTSNFEAHFTTQHVEGTVTFEGTTTTGTTISASKQKVEDDHSSRSEGVAVNKPEPEEEEEEEDVFKGFDWCAEAGAFL